MWVPPRFVRWCVWDWGITMRQGISAACIALTLAAICTAAVAQRISDQQVVSLIIQESIVAYKATGRPCACPYDLARNGSSCGGRSAYSRPGGASPKCYPADVSAADIAAWRARH